jgi:hypothetical protein
MNIFPTKLIFLVNNNIVVMFADPKELRRQRERERYALHSDEILKRRRQSREQKKIAPDNDKSDGTTSQPSLLLSHGDHYVQLLHIMYIFHTNSHCKV